MKFWPWIRKPLSSREQAITDSIKALKTLSVIDGRVSIDPREVLDQPGYIEARRQAAMLVRGPVNHQYCVNDDFGWSTVDELGAQGWSELVALNMQQARCHGLTYVEAIDRLKYLPLEGKTDD